MEQRRGRKRKVCVWHCIFPRSNEQQNGPSGDKSKCLADCPVWNWGKPNPSYTDAQKEEFQSLRKRAKQLPQRLAILGKSSIDSLVRNHNGNWNQVIEDVKEKLNKLEESLPSKGNPEELKKVEQQLEETSNFLFVCDILVDIPIQQPQFSKNTKSKKEKVSVGSLC
jgi:hypothetical protein